MRPFRNIFRLIFIAFVLLRYDVLCLRKSGMRRGERLAHALERLGPAFIKLGQAISTRSDFIGEDVAADLSRLRDDLPPFPSHQARAIIEAEFGKPLDELFVRFENTPIAAASIAQVHKAVTKDGSAVAVKVTRPGIEQAFARDIELFFWLAGLMDDYLPRYRRLKPREIIRTFKDTVFFELDLRFEAAAAEEMGANMKKHAVGMTIPDVDWNLTSRRVLTAQWVEGISFNDMEAIRESGFDTDALLEKMSRSLFAQVFIDGFFHADLHPGNLFLDTRNGELVAVDFGITGRLDWHSRATIARIVHGFLNEDYESVAELHFAAGYVPYHKNKEAFTQACRAVARPILGKPLNEISVAALLGQMFKIAAEFEMETQPQLLLMQKTLMVAEGVGRMLNPRLNMWELAKPLIEEWAGEQFSKTAQAKIALAEAKKHVLKLPEMLKKVERALDAIGEEGGLRLHPGSIEALNAARRKTQRPWLLLGWTALAAAIIIVWTAF
ncbi:MAG: 2-polyprenylphenol 6-hydroxylase [Alphaproteobacteria bacterium]|nr:2-polyprenylphenol 6-hydroxylase [Alphaproteobacteria bacterium]